jgi:hypothetical protein
MAILRSYKCPRHGFFDSWEPRCEHGCEDIDVVFLRPISVRTSGRTKNIDKTLNGLAAEYKMTDIKSTREGDHQTGYLKRNNAAPDPREPRAGDAAIWGGDAKFNMQNLLAGGAVRSVRGEQVGFNPKDANMTTGPRPDPKATFSDPEGLKIK